MRIAVTGANGFLGGHTVRALHGRGWNVTAVGRTRQSLAKLEAPGIQIVETDYSTESIGRWISGHDAIVHLAARRMGRTDPQRDIAQFLEPNIAGVERIADAAVAVGVRRIVFASSIAVYASSDPVPYLEDGPRHPINSYGLSKFIGEQILELKCRGTNTLAIALRFSALYGPGERTTGVLMRFISEAAAGRDLVIRGNKNSGVDQLYVEDAATAIAAALNDTSAHGVFNIGGGRARTVDEMAQAVAAAASRPTKIRDEGDSKTAAVQPHMSIEKAKRLLGWAPRHDLSEGIERTLRIVS